MRILGLSFLFHDAAATVVEDGEILYAVHKSDGERLALVKDRQMAFMLARQNHLSPVTVH